MIGLGVAAIAMSLAIPDRSFRRISEARLWLDRRTVRRLRQGEITEEEWLQESAILWKRVTRRDGTMFGVFLILVGVWLAL